MFKSTNNLIILAFGFLAIFSVGTLTAPKNSLAVNEDGYAYLDYPANPSPFVTSLNQNPNGTSVVIKGYGFMSTSVARVNGTNYPTSFIDSSHLLIKLNPNDLHNDEPLYISVFNEGPGGGYSNALSLKPTTNASNTYKNSNSYNANNGPDAGSSKPQNESDKEKNLESLAANAVFGVNTILPSGLIQWVLLAIIIILLVLVARRLMGFTDAYHSTPLKHD